MDALQRSLRELAQQVVALSPKFPKEVGDYLSQVKDPRYLVYLVASGTGLEVLKAQQILEIDSLKEKYRLLIGHLTREKEVLTIGKKIESEAREEMNKAQREYYLRQQLRAIQKELGESEPGQSEICLGIKPARIRATSGAHERCWMRTITDSKTSSSG